MLTQQVRVGILVMDLGCHSGPRHQDLLFLRPVYLDASADEGALVDSHVAAKLQETGGCERAHAWCPVGAGIITRNLYIAQYSSFADPNSTKSNFEHELLLHRGSMSICSVIYSREVTARNKTPHLRLFNSC